MKRFTALILLCILCVCACEKNDKTGEIQPVEGEAVTDLQDEKAGDGKQSEAVINVAISELNGLFNPLYENTPSDGYVNKLLFSYLSEIDENGDTVASLADCSANENYDEFTFTLKEQAFSSGEAITSDDVLFTLLVAADPSYAGNYDVSAMDIFGFEDYHGGVEKTLLGFEIIDEKSFKIKLNSPNPSFQSMTVFPVLSKNAYGKSFIFGATAGLYEITTPITCGAYNFDSYTENTVITLKKNDGYFKGAPKIDTINIMLTTVGNEVNLISEEKADMAFVAADKDVLDKAAADGLTASMSYENSYTFFGFNCQNGILATSAMRKAISYAIPREEIIKTVFGENASVINIPESKASYCYDENNCEPYAYDIEYANKLLSIQGYKLNADGYREKNGEVLEIRFGALASNPILDAAMPILDDSFRKIGARVSFESVELTTLYEKLFVGGYDMWLLEYDLSPNPKENLLIFTTGNVYNFSGYSNESVDSLYKSLAFARSKNEIKQFSKRAFDIINNELPILPFYQRKQALVTNERIGELSFTAFRDPFSELYRAELSE